MHRRIIIIDGNKFSNLQEFFDEMDRLLTKDLTWQAGRNLDALNDLLRGGFGVHEYGEPLAIHWISADKSKLNLGYDATVKYYKNMLACCHPTNRASVYHKLKMAKQHKGKTLMDMIAEIIVNTDDSGHDCTLELM